MCIDEIRRVAACGIDLEIVAVDNGSSDGTGLMLRREASLFHAFRIINEPRRGYGFAYMAGLKAATGRYLFMADADGSYSFVRIKEFVSALSSGADMAVGNRFAGLMESGAMPWAHRYIGNPALSFLVRIIFGVKIKDVHCGARALTRDAFRRLDLRTGGMEFASEMIIKAAKSGMTIAEIPVEYRLRLGRSKLRSFSDALRHLIFILLFSPLYMFVIPGAVCFLATAAGIAVQLSGAQGNSDASDYEWRLFFFSSAVFIGYQIVVCGGFAKVYAVNRLGDKEPVIEKMFRHLNIVRVCAAAVATVAVGAAFSVFPYCNAGIYAPRGISCLESGVIGLTITLIGVQTLFSAFVFSMLGIKGK